MPKAREYRIADPLDGPGLLEVDRRARKSLPSFATAFPQDLRYQAEYKAGKLPRPGGTPGLSIASTFAVACELRAEAMTRKSVAAIVAGVVDLKSVGVERPGLDLAASFELDAPRGCPRRSQHGSIRVQVFSDAFWFEFYSGGLAFDDSLDVARKVGAPEERRFIEETLERVIEAGRLPLRIAPAGRSFTVWPNWDGDGELRNHNDEPDEYAMQSFLCRLPDSSPEDLSRRFFDVLAAVPSRVAPSYRARILVGSHGRKKDPCPAAYARFLAQSWPATVADLETIFRVESAEGLDGLRKCFANARGARLPLGEFAAGPKKPARLLVHAQPRGHRLILQLDPEDEGHLGRIERILGVSFGK